MEEIGLCFRRENLGRSEEQLTHYILNISLAFQPSLEVGRSIDSRHQTLIFSLWKVEARNR
jgi:hypothetical protein